MSLGFKYKNEKCNLNPKFSVYFNCNYILNLKNVQSVPTQRTQNLKNVQIQICKFL